MYPNPQDVLPLPARPSLEQYKQRAKELVKACQSHDALAIRAWATEWIDALAHLQADADRAADPRERVRAIDQLDQFARTRLAPEPTGDGCALSDAQFVIARAHGFRSWPAFGAHLDALARSASPASTFEAAADAIVRGDASVLGQLLRATPGLIRARSAREHRATLLHYVAANGVENYRQRTPKNIVAITEMLLGAGADVDAEADVYGGGATTLGLAATSVHPFKAGVQNELIDVLVDHGASLDDPHAAGNRHGLIAGCLANGRPEAAQHLAARGARLNLEGAAGIGRLDVVKTYFANEGPRPVKPTSAQVTSAFAWASSYGRADVVDFLLEHGQPVDARLDIFGKGHKALHVAAYGAHVETIRTLLRHGAAVDVADETWGTTPLNWALHAWSQEPAAPAARYYESIALLVAAGSAVKPEWLEGENVRSDPRMLAALTITRNR